MKTFFYFILFFSCFFSICVAQDKEINIWEPITKGRPYLSYLLAKDSNTHATLLHCSYQYLYTNPGKPLRTGGMHFTAGLNIARFFTKKLILGVCFDVKTFKGKLKQGFTNSFKEDFNASFIPAYSGELDSARAYTLKESINNVEGFGVSGNNFQSIGVSISPFPDRYGGIMIQVKKSFFTFPFSGPYTKKIYKNGESHSLVLRLPECYSVEVAFNPFKCSKKKNIFTGDFPGKLYKFVIISLYCQKLSLTRANFDGLALTSITSAEFLNKYKYSYNYGLKIGIGLY